MACYQKTDCNKNVIANDYLLNINNKYYNNYKIFNLHRYSVDP